MSSARIDREEVVKLRMQLIIITYVYSLDEVNSDLLVAHSVSACTTRILQQRSDYVVLGVIDVSPAPKVNICAVELAYSESVITID